MRLAGHIGMTNRNEPVLRALVRKNFKANQLEQNPERIQELREE